MSSGKFVPSNSVYGRRRESENSSLMMLELNSFCFRNRHVTIALSIDFVNFFVAFIILKQSSVTNGV